MSLSSQRFHTHDTSKVSKSEQQSINWMMTILIKFCILLLFVSLVIFREINFCPKLEVMLLIFDTYQFFTFQINTVPMKYLIGYIDVVIPPSIIVEETSVDEVVSEGSNVTLKCRARGHPPPAIQWKREDRKEIPLQTLQGKNYIGKYQPATSTLILHFIRPIFLLFFVLFLRAKYSPFRTLYICCVHPVFNIRSELPSRERFQVYPSPIFDMMR